MRLRFFHRLLACLFRFLAGGGLRGFEHSVGPLLCRLLDGPGALLGLGKDLLHVLAYRLAKLVAQIRPRRREGAVSRLAFIARAAIRAASQPLGLSQPALWQSAQVTSPESAITHPRDFSSASSPAKPRPQTVQLYVVAESSSVALA